MIERKKWRNRVFIFLGLISIAVFYFSLPSRLFDNPYSTVLLDRNSELLGAFIASDGQWRFPEKSAHSVKFQQALLHFEDEYFYYHPGVNPASILRALFQNLKSGEIISGGSTISMQVIRLSRKKPRTLWEKCIEILLSIRLELSFSKNEIFGLYASNAPYGGNVVGIEAASWRYYHRKLEDLSWGEASLLAVLPNNPSMIHPGRNREALRAKRDRLLDKLLAKSVIDSLTCTLSKAENIPDRPVSLPRFAPHLLQRAINDQMEGSVITSTIDLNTQKRASLVLKRAYSNLKANEIHNAAALVANAKTGQVLAYVGNIDSGQNHEMEVDIIQSRRSTGSILKPFLYSAMINEGLMYPQELIPDIPIYIDGFNPKNFTSDYDGAVKADEALARSLNVPAVQLLRRYRYEKFHALLQELGMSTLTNEADRYGLSLILGGAEATLWDLSEMYAQISNVLSNPLDVAIPKLSYRLGKNPVRATKYPFQKGVLWHTVEALSEVKRPTEEGNWRVFSSSTKIAWKTGTSFGHRDAWAIGITPEYVVGVWTGNADGEGRPGLTGLRTAAPIMFDIFSGLQNLTWFSQPTDRLVENKICMESGQRATKKCDKTELKYIFDQSKELLGCTYHKTIHINKSHTKRVTSKCERINDIESVSWFILPPAQEYYYRKKQPEYRPLPPMSNACIEQDPFQSMQFIYPNEGSRIYIPKGLDGTKEQLLLQVAHRNNDERIFWHIDDQYEGSTYAIHQLAINPEPGLHKITLIDENGHILERNIQFLTKE